MEPVLQLDDFGLTDLRVHWEAPQGETGEVTSRFDVGYTCKHFTADPRKYKLTLTVKDRRSSAAGSQIANLEATIVGFFTFPPETEVADREKRIRINGLTMLYGALRGTLAAVCGVFPPDSRYVLPTVNMLDVIKAVEAKHADQASRLRTGRQRKRQTQAASRARRPSPVPARTDT